MVDENTAEKALHDYCEADGIPLEDREYPSDVRRDFMAGRASRDAEVAAKDNGIEDAQNRLRDLRYDNSKLREQLAEARAEVERRPEPAFRDALIADRNKAESALAEAQATIEKAATVLTASHEYHEPDDDAWWAEHYDTIITQAISILSASSSTGGE